MIIDFSEVDDPQIPKQLVPRPDGFICTIGTPEIKEFLVTHKDTGEQDTATAFTVKFTSDGGDGYGTGKWFFNHPFSPDATRIGWERTKALLGACGLPNTGSIDTSNIVEWIQGKKVHATFKYGKEFPSKDDPSQMVKLVELSWCQPVDRAPPGAKVKAKPANTANTATSQVSNQANNQVSGQNVESATEVGSSVSPPPNQLSNPPAQPVQQQEVETDTDYQDDIPF